MGKNSIFYYLAYLASLCPRPRRLLAPLRLFNGSGVQARYACSNGSGVQARYACSNGSGVQARYACSNGSGVQARYASLKTIFCMHPRRRFTALSVFKKHHSQSPSLRAQRSNPLSRCLRMIMDCRVGALLLLAMTIALPLTAHAQCADPAGVEGEIIMNTTFGIPAYCDGSDNWVAMSGGNTNIAVAPTTGLVGHWPLNEASGDAVDIINGNDALVEGSTGTITYQVPSPAGNGVAISGNERKFQAGDPPELDITGAVTVSAWVNMDTSNDGVLVSKRGSDGNRAYRLLIATGGVAVFAISPDGSALEESGPSPALTPGQWYHLVGVFEPSTRVSLYVNGVLSSENTTSISASIFNSSQDFRIGGWAPSGNGAFDGSIDDVRVYNVALTGDEVADLYAATGGAVQSTATEIVPDGLVGHWRLDETEGTTAFDSSGNDLDGDFLGGMDPASSSVDGVIQTGLRFDGTPTEYRIDVPYDSLLDTTDTTIAAWFRVDEFDSQNAYSIIHQEPISTARMAMSVDMPENSLRCSIGNTDGTTQITGANNLVLEGVWYHGACVHDTVNDTFRAFLNGMEVASSSTTANPSKAGTVLSIGYRNRDNGAYTADFFNGDIDDVRLYNRVLDEDEIAEIVNARDGIRYNDAQRTYEYFDGNKYVSMTPEWSEPNPNAIGAGDYLPNAVDFEAVGGTNLLDDTGYNPGASQQLTLSYWFRRDSVGANDYMLDADGASFPIIQNYLTSGNQIFTSIRDASDTVIFGDAIPTAHVLGEWNHYMISMDFNTGDRHVYFNDADQGCCSTFVGGGVPNFDFANIAIGSQIDGSFDMRGAMADMWIDFGTYIDLSVEANRRLFIDASGNPVNLGSDGSLPTGSTPDIFLSGDTDTWHINDGMGGDFTEYGELITATTVPGATSQGLIAHYEFEETTGTTATDSSGKGNDGTLQSLTFDEHSVQGVVGRGLYLPNGTHGSQPTSFRVQAADVLPTTPNQPFTVSSWIYDLGGIGGSYWHIDDASLGEIRYLKNGTAQRIVTPVGFEQQAGVFDEWQHIVFVYDGTDYDFYIDNVELFTPDDTYTTSFVNGDFNIGAVNSGMGETRGFIIDDVRIYDRVLTAAERTQLYNMGTPAGTSTALPQGCPNIGDVCDDGTVYAGLSPDGNVEMFVAPLSTRTSLPWNNGNTTDNTTTSVTNSDTGEANTNTLAVTDSDSSVFGIFDPHQAAEYCYSLISNGAADWYLPANNEIDDVLAASAIVDPATAGNYWSSQENDNSSAERLEVDSDGGIITGGSWPKGSVVTLNVLCARKGPAPRCANPYGLEGTIIYNTDEDVAQYCDGARWLAIGKYD